MFQAEGTACTKALETRISLVGLRNRKYVSISGLQQAQGAGRVQIMHFIGLGREFSL